jgi:RNA polymerase sigma-70 factor (ECF subfamily)
MNGFSDPSTLELLKLRDRRAWELLYDELASDLRGFVQRIGASDPDDIVSETMLQIVRDVDSFTGTLDELRPWAFRIARHRVVDVKRRTKRRPTEVQLTPANDFATLVGQDSGGLDLSKVSDAFQALTPDQREVLWLRYAMDFSLDTTAEIMGSTPDAIASMAYRALTRLRQLL